MSVRISNLWKVRDWGDMDPYFQMAIIDNCISIVKGSVSAQDPQDQAFSTKEDYFLRGTEGRD